MAPFTAQQQPLDSYPLSGKTLASTSRVVNTIIIPTHAHHPTPLLPDGTRVPMATVQLAAVIGALLTGWVAVQAKG